MPVGLRAPVDLGRHDRVGHVEILVARPGVEADDVVPELTAPAVEELPPDTTVYELDSPAATATPEFQAMRGWYEFAPHVRSRTQTIVPTRSTA